MENNKLLSDFFAAISKDARISSTHIGVFAALLEYRNRCGLLNPIRVYSYEIMELAKISASTTYHRCVRDLHKFGYIDYVASFNSAVGSQIYFQVIRD
ncbi:hypothetical protein E6C50_01785 [Flavobacterium supellecticarium]|uniref:Helix-turn-helix domain-containing protein n=1 Tax=Flavobacterium supellecticarium TaxID=2565924 RepID=A0A4S4A3W0_9FLAO|nr:hypothetical protein E6C50_01785 [Flavobacterium supellecticarium]